MPTKRFEIDDWLSNLGGTSAGGNSNDNHIPMGLVLGGTTFVFTPALLQFALDFDDVISITSAKLWLKTSAGSHVSVQALELRVRRITSSWSEHGGSEGNWSGSREDPSTTSSGQRFPNFPGSEDTWESVTITDIVQAWMNGSTNHGLELSYDVEAGSTNPKTTEFYSGDAVASKRPYIELTYVSNSSPDAPTLSSPANGLLTSDSTPNFGFTHHDDDGDALASYDLQVSTDSDFSSVTHWDASNQTTGISGNTVSRDYAGTALTRGVTYYWRARTNDGTSDGAWSATRSFTYNGLPTVTKNSPAASTLAAIHNLADLALWTGAGSHAKPVFKFTPADGESDLTKYRLRIYSAAVAGSTVYDSGEVALAMTSGDQVTIDCSQALVNGTEYWWTIDVYDGLEWAGESSRTAFKVRWAQGLFEHDTGATSANWSFNTGTLTGDVAVLFRSATSSGGDAATGKSSFASVIASVPVQQWLQVLVRLSTDGTLADMTFTYNGTPNTPDGWSTS